jgi:Icc-related predicted phosphoesterase
MTSNGAVRIAALADVHFSKSSRGTLQSTLDAIRSSADVLLACGDLTHDGRAAEAAVLAEELSALRLPIIAVLGNHDFHAGEQEEIQRILTDAGVQILDGGIAQVGHVGFAGVKGFAGGFDKRLLEPWGESIVKQFVHEALSEALKLETALARLTTQRRVVLLHYSPISQTVEGEPLEIYPFLGSTRLEEPINRFEVTAVFHGHAHHGRAEGHTARGVPVYNVSLPLMRGLSPEGPWVRILEIPPWPSPEPVDTPQA